MPKLTRRSGTPYLFTLALAGFGAVAAHAGWQQTSLAPTSGVFGLGVVNTAIFAGTGVATGDGSGIMQSSNACETWTESNQGFGSSKFYAQAFLSHNDKIFAGIKSKGIYASADGGATWSLAGASSQSITGFAKGGGKLFASSKGGGVWISADNGATWTATAGLGIAANKQMLAIGYSGTTVFAASNGYGAFKSTDDGATWSPVEGEAPASLSVFTRTVLVDEGTIYISYDNQGIRKSTDGGATWTLHSSGLTSGTFMALIKTPVGILVGTNGGLFHSGDNGVTWAATNTGLGTSKSINVLAVLGDKVLAGTNETGLWIRPASELAAATAIFRRDIRGVEPKEVSAFNPGIEGYSVMGRTVRTGAYGTSILIPNP